MIQEPHSLAADASKMASTRNTTVLVEDVDQLSASAHKRAMKQQEQTSQYYLAEPPEGGKGEDWDPLSIHLAQGRQPLHTACQQVIQDIHTSTDPQRLGKSTGGALHSMNVCADASMHLPHKVMASSPYLSHSPTKHANLEEGCPTDDKPSCQRRDFTRAYHSQLTNMMGGDYESAKNTIKTNWRPLSEKESQTEVFPDRIRYDHIETSTMHLCNKLVSISHRRWGSDCAVEGNSLRPSYGNEGRHKWSASFCMWRIFALISLAVASTDLRVIMFADAVFSPGTRTELQGDGTFGVFGCIGTCGGPLKTYNGNTYCDTGGCCSSNWGHNTGNPCHNADTDVPSGQGTGKYGMIGSWDVSKVDNMAHSKFVTRCITL